MITFFTTFGITIPSATTTIADIGSWSSEWFNELLPIGYVALGIFLGFYLIKFIINFIMDLRNKEDY